MRRSRAEDEAGGASGAARNASGSSMSSSPYVRCQLPASRSASGGSGASIWNAGRSWPATNPRRRNARPYAVPGFSLVPTLERPSERASLTTPPTSGETSSSDAARMSSTTSRSPIRAVATNPRSDPPRTRPKSADGFGASTWRQRTNAASRTAATRCHRRASAHSASNSTPTPPTATRSGAPRTERSARSAASPAAAAIPAARLVEGFAPESARSASAFPVSGSA